MSRVGDRDSDYGLFGFRECFMCGLQPQYATICFGCKVAVCAGPLGKLGTHETKCWRAHTKDCHPVQSFLLTTSGWAMILALITAIAGLIVYGTGNLSHFITELITTVCVASAILGFLVNRVAAQEHAGKWVEPISEDIDERINRRRKDRQAEGKSPCGYTG